MQAWPPPLLQKARHKSQKVRIGWTKTRSDPTFDLIQAPEWSSRACRFALDIPGKSDPESPRRNGFGVPFFGYWVHQFCSPGFQSLGASSGSQNRVPFFGYWVHQFCSPGFQSLGARSGSRTAFRSSVIRSMGSVHRAFNRWVRVPVHRTAFRSSVIRSISSVHRAFNRWVRVPVHRTAFHSLVFGPSVLFTGLSIVRGARSGSQNRVPFFGYWVHQFCSPGFQSLGALRFRRTAFVLRLFGPISSVHRAFNGWVRVPVHRTGPFFGYSVHQFCYRAFNRWVRAPVPQTTHLVSRLFGSPVLLSGLSMVGVRARVHRNRRTENRRTEET